MMIDLLALAAATVSVAPHAEMALRCTVVENAPLFARNAPSLAGPLSGGPLVRPPMKPLPQMMVVGWSVDGVPVAEALSQLGAGAGFTVVADPGLAPVSWNGEQASLSVVVTRLAQAAGGTPSFDGKVLTISKPLPVAPWKFQRPAGRDATLALLDALRGYGATDVRLGTEAVTFQASEPVATRIRKGLSSANSVIAFDVWSYRVKPTAATIDWKRLDALAPVSERHPVGSGGRFVMGYVPAERVSAFLRSSGEVRELGSQTVAGPQGWSMEVPLSQCAAVPEAVKAVMLKPIWTGQTMSVEFTGPSLDQGRIDVLSPGSAAIVAGQPVSGWTTVALVRPRVLSSR